MPNAYDFFLFFIEPEDLKGAAVPVTISKVTVEETFNPGTKKKDVKPVLHFVGKKKVLSMNKTRTKKMIEITGSPEFDQWTGVRVVLTAGVQSAKQTIVISAAEGEAAKMDAVTKANLDEMETLADQLDAEAQKEGNHD